MNCAEQLVEIFGSQADVARAFQLDRAVVHNWVKTGYVPERWAGELERITQGRINALDIINEASAKNPVRVKSRPGHLPFGLPESDPMSQYAPSKRIQSFHPPQRTLMGPGPTEIHPRVLTTMSQPAIGYLDPVFVDMMEELKSLLRYVYQTKNPLTFPLSGISSARQKGPASTPGRWRVSLCERGGERGEKRKGKTPRWFMGMKRMFKCWRAGGRTYRHPGLTNNLLAGHEALLLIREEGL